MLGAKVGLSSKQLRSSDSDPHNVSLTGGSSCNPGTDMGDGDTSYNAIHINDDGDDVHDTTSVYDTDRNISTSTDNGGGSKVNFDVETRHVDENAMSRERRLTLRQLERFRRAMTKRSHRGSRTGGRWGNGPNQVASLDSVSLTSRRNSVWY